MRALTLNFAMLLVPLCVGAAGGAGGCTPRYEKNWHKLKPRMDRLEVREMLGEPTTIFPALRGAATRPSDEIMLAVFLGEDFDRERWVYGPRGWLGGLGNLFGPSVDAYVVYYDSTRRVQRWREPLAPGAHDPATAADKFFIAYARAACAEDGAAGVFDPIDGWPRATRGDPPAQLDAGREAPDYIVLHWKPPSDNADGTARYVVQIGGIPVSQRPSDAAVFPFEWLTFLTPRTSMKLRIASDDDPEATWFWRVRKLSETAASNWSGWQHIPPGRPPHTATQPSARAP